MIDSPAIKGKVTQIQLGSTLEGYTFHPLQTSAFHHQIDFSGKHAAMLQLPCEDYSLSMTVYSFIHLSELNPYGENENALTLKQQQRGFKPRFPRLSLAFYRRATVLHYSDNYHNMNMSAHTHVDLFMCNMSCLNMSNRNESNWHDQIIQIPSGTNLAC